MNWIMVFVFCVLQVLAVGFTGYAQMTWTKKGREFTAWRKAKQEEKERELQDQVAASISAGNPEEAAYLIEKIRSFKKEII